MTSRALIGTSILLGSLVTACAHRGGAPPGDTGTAPVQPLSQTIRVDFGSSIPDEHWVLSGPAEVYQKLEVNQHVRKAVERYAERKSGGTTGEPLVLNVRVDRFHTGFRAIGALADTAIPEEIQKSAQLGLSAELLRGGRSLGRRQIEQSVTEVQRWIDGPVGYPDYGYQKVLDRVVRRALEDLDAFVNQAAGSSG